MMITREVEAAINESVLCWLGSVSSDGVPNVSPKEAFIHDGAGKLLIANIASPVSQKNLGACDRVCVSFIEIFTQKGYKIEGRARVLNDEDEGYGYRKRKLLSVIGDSFDILSIFEISPLSINRIIAPSYRVFPDSSEDDRIKESITSYRVAEYQDRQNKTK
ncbi:MAG: pyridoxamine 5'-phosphate oxidase family protein [Opitutales bacterium]